MNTADSSTYSYYFPYSSMNDRTFIYIYMYVCMYVYFIINFFNKIIDSLFLLGLLGCVTHHRSVGGFSPPLFLMIILVALFAPLNFRDASDYRVPKQSCLRWNPNHQVRIGITTKESSLIGILTRIKVGRAAGVVTRVGRSTCVDLRRLVRWRRRRSGHETLDRRGDLQIDCWDLLESENCVVGHLVHIAAVVSGDRVKVCDEVFAVGIARVEVADKLVEIGVRLRDGAAGTGGLLDRTQQLLQHVKLTAVECPQQLPDLQQQRLNTKSIE